MLVVMIVGVLATMAIYGVRKFLANAKTSEAKHTIGGIHRAAVAAYNREGAAAELLGAGQSSGAALHRLCATARPVPASDAAIRNRKYQPTTALGQDYESVEWRCLKFSQTEPQYYRYVYTKGGKSITTIASPTVPATGWSTEARGDLDGDNVFSGFMLVGNVVRGEPIKSTEIAEEYPDE
jgi:type IV pilus assembly protein PilA